MADDSTPQEVSPIAGNRARLRSRRLVYFRDGLVKAGLVLCAAFSVIVTFTIVVVLLTEASRFFVQAGEVWKKESPAKVAAAQAAVEQAQHELANGPAAVEEAARERQQAQQQRQQAQGELARRQAEEKLVAAEQKLADARNKYAEAERMLPEAERKLAEWNWKQQNASALGIVRGFFGSATWSPQYTQSYGVWPLISGTVMVALIAMAVALPLGLVTAVYLSEYAPRKVRSSLKPTLEILAGIPTVVYGYFALRIITPGLITLHEGFSGFNALSAGLMVGVLCLPTVTSLAEDALQAVPRSLRDAAYGLGGTRFDVSLKVVVPAALSGIVSAFLLAIARAVGETMIVALAAGSTANLTLDPRSEIQTMTGYMVQIISGDAPHGTPEYYSLYAVAAVLFAMTLVLTVMGNIVRKRFREAYS